MYIAGADPILIEKNAIKTTISLFGDGEGLALAKTLITFYQSFIFTNEPVDFVLEKTLEIISEFHYPLSKQIANLLENEKTSLDDFIENFQIADSISDFILQLFELFSYNPYIEEIKDIPEKSLRNFSKLLLSI